MSTIFPVPIDNVSAPLASPGRGSGASVVSLSPNTGSLFGNPSPSSPLRVNLVPLSAIDSNGYLAHPEQVSVFTCNGRTGDTLTGLVLESGPDASFHAGDICAVLDDSSYIIDLQRAVNNLESSLGQIFPTPVGHDGGFLRTVGGALQWATPLPDQSGQAGKYLTTDGSAASWATVDLSDVVHRSGVETITGAKTFTAPILVQTATAVAVNGLQVFDSLASFVNLQVGRDAANSGLIQYYHGLHTFKMTSTGDLALGAGPGSSLVFQANNQVAGGMGPNGNWTLTALTAGTTPLALQLATSQSADAFQVKDVLGVALTSIDANGGLTIKGKPGVYSLTVTDPAGNPTLQYDPNGILNLAGTYNFGSGLRATAYGAYVGVLDAQRFVFNSNGIDAYGGSPTDVVLRLHGTTSQSGDLLQWQDSIGSPLGGISATGNLGLGTAGNLIFANAARGLSFSSDGRTYDPNYLIQGSGGNLDFSWFGGSVHFTHNSTTPGFDVRMFNSSGTGTTVYTAYRAKAYPPATPLAGFGARFQVQAGSTTTNFRDVADFRGTWVDPTDATRKGRASLVVADYTGTDKEGLRVESDGTQALLGFFGGNATAKSVLSYSRSGAGETAALAAVRSALASLGLITDSTTA